MHVTDILLKRYSVKEFDSSKKLTVEELDELEALLELSPSSTNVQPWHFIIATSDEGKKRIAKATHGFYRFNEQKVLDAPAVAVFATRIDITKEYLTHVLDKEEKDGRFSSGEYKGQMHDGRSVFVNMHVFDLKDIQHWAEKQVYLNVGHFLFGATSMGLDTVAMEGFDFACLDEELGLREQGFTSTVVVAVGHHREGDFNKALPKSRLMKNEIISRI